MVRSRFEHAVFVQFLLQQSHVIFRTQYDSALATEFQQNWKKADRANFEIEMFGLALNNSDIEGMMSILGNFLRSDHANFWLDNIPAIFLTDSGKEILQKMCMP